MFQVDLGVSGGSLGWVRVYVASYYDSFCGDVSDMQAGVVVASSVYDDAHVYSGLQPELNGLPFNRLV